MAIVVQVISRAGQVLQTHRFDQDHLRVGRGLDCDLILQDPHLDARHLNIVKDPISERLHCEDLASLNGSWHMELNARGGFGRKKRPVTGLHTFFSGQVFEIGKTFIRVSLPEHAMLPALPLSRWENIGLHLSHVWLFVGLAVLLYTFNLWDKYISFPDKKLLSRLALEGLNLPLGAVVYAGIFAFIGKIFRHDAKFTAHFSIALSCLLVSSGLDFAMPYLAFNLDWGGFFETLNNLLGAFIIFIGVWVSLCLATQLSGWLKLSVAAIGPILIAISVAGSWLGKDDFSERPTYNKALVEPAGQWRRAVTPQEFVQSTHSLYSAVSSASTSSASSSITP